MATVTQSRLAIATELSIDDLNDVLAFAESFDGPPPLPMSIDEIHALSARLRDDDDEDGLPAGIPPRRYWPDPAWFHEMRIVCEGQTSEPIRRFRTQWRSRLYKRNPYCRWCAYRVRKVQATLDHIIPLSRGGADHPLNYAMSCQRCNSARSDMTPADQIQVILTGKIPRHVAESRVRRDMANHRRVDSIETIDDADDTEGGAA